MSDYGALINPAIPGVVGDTGDYNIDGTCFVSDLQVFSMCGRIAWAKVIDGQYKEVATHFDGIYHIPYGVIIRSHTCVTKDKDGMMGYESGEPCSLLTHGRVWVVSENIDQPPRAGDPVHVARDGSASKGGIIVSGWSYTGGWAKWNGKYFIVEIQVKQNAAHTFEDHGIPLNGAVIHAALPSPQPYNKIIKLDIEVSPADATDKGGVWHVSDPALAELDNHHHNDQYGTESVYLMSKNYIGKVWVTWVANDGSGVQAMIEYEFTQ